MKNSEIAANSKANHLSYIGDSNVGSRVNIGAGTITCNYDSANKHRTVIEDDVFIGSDTQLVAPVTVKRGATIGAGSTITRDAPEGAVDTFAQQAGDDCRMEASSKGKKIACVELSAQSRNAMLFLFCCKVYFAWNIAAMIGGTGGGQE